MKRRMILLFGIVLFFVLVGSVSAADFCESPAGNCWYIDPINGDDSNDGLSEITAFKHLNSTFRVNDVRGILYEDEYTAETEPYVYLMDGTFYIDDTVLISGKWITIKNYPGHFPRIYSNPANTDAANTVKLYWSNEHITLDGLDIEGGSSFALKIDGGLGNHYNTVKNCKIHGGGQENIKLTGDVPSQGGNSENTFTIFEYNEIYDSGFKPLAIPDATIMYYDSSADTYLDISNEVWKEDNLNFGVEFDSGDYVYVGARSSYNSDQGRWDRRNFDKIRFNGGVFQNAGKINIDYWNSGGWTPVTRILDKTDINGNTLSKPGFILFQTASYTDWPAGGPDVNFSPDHYYVRFSTDNFPSVRPLVDLFAPTLTANSEGIDANAISNATIRNNYFHDILGVGMYFKGNCEDILIENNFLQDVGFNSNFDYTVYDTWGGIYCGECMDQAYIPVAPKNYEAINCVVKNNVLSNIGGSALRAMGAKNATFIGNTIYNENRPFSVFYGYTDTGALTVYRGCSSPAPIEYNKDISFTGSLVIDSQAQGALNQDWENQVVLIGAEAWDTELTVDNLVLDNNFYYRRDSDYLWMDKSPTTPDIVATDLDSWQNAMPVGIDANSVVSDGNNLIAIMENPTLPVDDPCSYARRSSVPNDIGADVELVGISPGCVSVNSDADVNFDSLVNVIDLAIVSYFQGHFLPDSNYNHLDIDGDGDIDFDDILEIVSSMF